MAEWEGVSHETHDGVSAAAAPPAAANAARAAGDSEREMSELVYQAQVMAELNNAPQQDLGREREV